MPKKKSFPVTESFSESLRAGGTQNAIGRRTACVFDDKLHTITTVVGFGAGPWQRHNWIDLKAMMNPDGSGEGLGKINIGYLADGANWKSHDAWTMDGSYQRWSISNSVGLTANNSAMYMIFRGHGFRLLGKKYAPPEFGGPAEWGEDIRMCRPHNGPQSDNPDSEIEDTFFNTGTSVAASFYGERQLLVAGSGPDHTFLLYLFDTDDIDEDNNVWVARSYREIALADLRFFRDGNSVAGATASGLYDRAAYVDLVWFSVVPAKDSRSKEPDIRLAISVTPQNFSADGRSVPQSFTCYFDLPLKDDDSGEIDDRDGETFKHGGIQADLCPEGVESGLIKDPSGRLRSFFVDEKNREIGSIYTWTAKAPDPGEKIQRTVERVPAYRYSESQASYVRPGGAFVLFEDGSETTTENGNRVKTIPVLEFLFYGDGRYQVSHYGTVRAELFNAKLDPKNEKNVIVGGIFDGPVPFPVENFIGINLGSDNQGIAGYVYGSEKSTEVESASESGWHAGVESAGHMTEGVGPAWKFSLDGGMSTAGKFEHSTTIERELSVECGVSNPYPYKEPQAEGEGLVSTLQARLHIAAYQFIDSAGKIVNDALTSDAAASAKLLSTLTSMTSASSTVASFPCYLVKPGDLASYTPERINARMRELGYKGEDYFREIVCRNAYPMTDSDDFLLYTWDAANSNKTKIKTMKSSFKEQEWHLEVDAYIGLSGESGVKVPLLGGEKLEWEILGGGGYEQSKTDAELREQEWSLMIEGKLNNAWGPEVNEHVGNAVKAYTFRTYFLPVPDHRSELRSTHWAEELRSALKREANPESRLTADMIDPGSGAWRILFVVTKIDYVDREKYPPYKYEASGEPQSVLRNGSSVASA